MKDLVSVIIPAYNHEKYIKECIESVLNQTYENIEVLVEDDCSTDKTKEIIKSIEDKRLKKFYAKKNKGVVQTINELTKKCNGKYIAVLGSDDVWYPTKIEEQVKVFKKNPKLGAVFTQLDLIDEKGNVYPKEDPTYKIFNNTNMKSYERLRVFYQKGNHLCHPTSMISKKAIEDIGPYNRAFRQLHDYEYWTRLLQKYEIHIIPKRLIGYRRELTNSKSISSSTIKNLTQMYNELFYINYKMILNMNSKNLKDGFSDLFKNKNSKTELELLCEKYFLLLNMSFGCNNNNYAFSLLFNNEMQDELFDILETKFNYTLKDFYKDTSKNNKIYPDNIVNEKFILTMQEKDKIISNLNQEITNMTNSKSWKITKPIRAIRRLGK